MAQALFIRYRKERSVYQLCWMEQGYQGHLQITVTLKKPQAALGAG